MLEVYTVKKSLESTRQELSHALYQHDAACRVIARLIRERDEARKYDSLIDGKNIKKNCSAVVQIQNRVGQIQAEGIENQSSQKTFTVTDANGSVQEVLPTEIVNQINETAIQLNTMRREVKKNKNAFADYATKDVLFLQIKL